MTGSAQGDVDPALADATRSIRATHEDELPRGEDEAEREEAEREEAETDLDAQAEAESETAENGEATR